MGQKSSKYRTPVAERVEIIQRLGQCQGPQTLEQLVAHFGYQQDGDREEGLRRRLVAMSRDGEIVRNRRGAYGLIARMDLVRGRVQGHPDGFGFVIPDDEGEEDLFLHARQMRTLMDGDRVLVSIIGINKRGKREGQLVEVLERGTHQVVGRYLIEQGVGMVVPTNRRLSHEILVPPEDAAGAGHDQIVLVELVAQPSRHSAPIGRVVEVLGDHMAPGMEIDIAIRAFEIPHQWPVAVERQAAAIPSTVPAAVAAERTDFRSMPLLTIDGEDARDFDDAVCCKRTPKGWKLLVAIADVSHYVQPGSALDQEAVRRGNSVYFPNHVVPMLPESLSNGICSLNPDVERLCMVCEMWINQSGEVSRSRFHRGVMRSVARMTYTGVAQALEGRSEALDASYSRYLPQLQQLHQLYLALLQARKRRGAIEFETTETKIIFGEGKKIERIDPLERNDAHRMIEEFMIAANVCAARLLKRKRVPTLYRVHERPDSDRLDEVRQFLREFGITLTGGDQPQPKDYAQVLEQARQRPEFSLIQTVLLRSLNRAVYSPETEGHFGLAHAHYAHFTSPIRRYPDLLVHRAILHLLVEESFPYDRAAMVKLGEECSTTERRADDATRDVMEWLKCEYMMDHVGERYRGVISGVTGFGIFVTLDQFYVDGLVHITSLENDYYHFDPTRHLLKGEQSGRSYRLGDQVEVQVARVDLDERKIDFVLANHADRQGQKRPRRRAKTSASGGGQEGERRSGETPSQKRCRRRGGRK